MNHEKVFKREDGTKLRIVVGLIIPRYFDESARWNVNVMRKGKDQKLWRCLPDTLSHWEYRKLSTEGREKHTEENNLRFVTKEEILSTKIELWNKLKPE